jgi:hypothetical protein
MPWAGRDAGTGPGAWRDQRQRQSLRALESSTRIALGTKQLRSAAMVTGSCQCGGIRFEIERVIALTHCHCSVCRKTTDVHSRLLHMFAPAISSH